MSGFLTEWLDWSGRTPRARYAVALVIFFTFLVVSRVAMDLMGQPAHLTGIVTAVTTLLTVPLIGFGIRRFHDMGRNGAWVIVQLVPIIGLGISAWLLFGPTKEDAAPPKAPRALVTLGVLGVCLFAVFGVSRLVWAPYWIPSGSMKPTLLIGDYLIADRNAATPTRGDVVIFKHPTQDTAFIARVIGLPGDSVGMEDGAVLLNGEPVPQQEDGLFIEPRTLQGPYNSQPLCFEDATTSSLDCTKNRWIETLPDGPSYATLDVGVSPLDTVEAVTVPDGAVFVMGDNRDNSTDSRVSQNAAGVGFVPAENLIGRADRVIFSSAGRRMVYFWTWRGDRFFKALD